MNNKEFPLFELWDKLGNKTNGEVKKVIFHCDRCMELVLEATAFTLYFHNSNDKIK